MRSTLCAIAARLSVITGSRRLPSSAEIPQRLEVGTVATFEVGAEGLVLPTDRGGFAKSVMASIVPLIADDVFMCGDFLSELCRSE